MRIRIFDRMGLSRAPILRDAAIGGPTLSNNNPYGYGAPPPSQGQPQGYGPPQQQPYYPPQQAPVVYVQQNTIAMRPPFNHGAHIAVSVFTCGAWLPFYLLIWLLRS